jgi:hypothetical protein
MNFSISKRTTALMCFSAALLWTSLSPCDAQTDVPREARIQSVLILRLIKFVEWPPSSMLPPDVLHICTWGDSPTEVALKSLQGQKVREREIHIRKLVAPMDTRGCQVLYVSNTVRDVNPNMLYGSGSRAVLTISDMLEFNKRGGIINLVRQDNRIGFEIQLRNAREQRLNIGAPLLELARVVD